MAETHDTIDSLLAEFRGYSAFMPPSYHVTMSWHDFRRMLNRFEAAHKREAVTDCNQFGNAAKLREALEMVCDAHYTKEVGGELYEGFEVEVDDGTGRPLICVVKNALAAPPRNCDKVKTSWDVLKKWHEGLDTANDIVRMLDWLLAPATEKEGGNDGNE